MEQRAKIFLLVDRNRSIVFHIDGYRIGVRIIIRSMNDERLSRKAPKSFGSETFSHSREEPAQMITAITAERDRPSVASI